MHVDDHRGEYIKEHNDRFHHLSDVDHFVSDPHYDEDHLFEAEPNLYEDSFADEHYEDHENPYLYAEYGALGHHDAYDHDLASLYHGDHEYGVAPYQLGDVADYDHLAQAGWSWDPYDPYHVDPRHSTP